MPDFRFLPPVWHKTCDFFRKVYDFFRFGTQTYHLLQFGRRLNRYYGDLTEVWRTRPERTMSGVRKPSPESSVPGENLTRGSRRNQLRRGHGSPPVLSEVPHELSIPMRTPKSANGPRSNSFRPDSPLTTTFNQGRKTQPAPSPHRTWSVPDASSQPQLNLQFTVTVLVYENLRILSLFLPLLSCIMKMGYGQEKLMGC